MATKLPNLREMNLNLIFSIQKIIVILTTPRQMVKNLQVYIFGDILSDDKKKLLIDWMSDNSITDTLIKAETPGKVGKLSTRAVQAIMGRGMILP